MNTNEADTAAPPPPTAGGSAASTGSGCALGRACARRAGLVVADVAAAPLLALLCVAAHRRRPVFGAGRPRGALAYYAVVLRQASLLAVDAASLPAFALARLSPRWARLRDGALSPYDPASAAVDAWAELGQLRRTRARVPRAAPRARAQPPAQFWPNGDRASDSFNQPPRPREPSVAARCRLARGRAGGAT